jgi:Spy/CpxP family protein refolding chaperone
MKHASLAMVVGCLAVGLSACAQNPHAGHGDGHSGHSHAQYAGLQKRTIKALSEQQIADIRAGRGMSLAMPAELNGYPGPSHVLELAGPLALTEPQRARTQALFEQMQREARAAGEELIASETVLDQLFKGRTVTPALLSQATARAAAAQGALRETHLRFHLSMMEVLTPAQVATYNRLRGY